MSPNIRGENPLKNLRPTTTTRQVSSVIGYCAGKSKAIQALESSVHFSKLGYLEHYLFHKDSLKQGCTAQFPCNVLVYLDARANLPFTNWNCPY